MTWDYDNLASKDVIIGYNTGDGMFVNTHLENPPFNTSAMRFTPDQFNGTTGLQVEYNGCKSIFQRVIVLKGFYSKRSSFQRFYSEGSLF